MEELEDNFELHKYKLYLDIRKDRNFPTGFGFLHSDRTINSLPENDFYLPIFLEKSTNKYEYVDVQKDETIEPIERQEINPYFIEFGFFDDIIRNKIIRGEHLTLGMSNFIKEKRPEIANLSFQDLKKWFDEFGKFELPWSAGTTNEVTIDDIETSSIQFQHIVSKAGNFSIEINK